MNDRAPLAAVVPLDSARQNRQPPTSGGDDSSLFQGVLCEIPPCPQHLGKEARKHYRFMAAELKKAGMIAKIDQGTLANLCIYWERAKAAEIELQEHGEFQKTPNDYFQLSPWAVAFQRYSSEYNKLAQKFGMTPVARKGVKVENPNQGGLNLD